MNDYIKTMRSMIGQETLLTVGCGTIIENEYGSILMQQRTDFGIWGIPGGILELGETFEETVKREVLEETNLKISQLELFGIYSGENGFAQYENGDKVFSVQIIFRAKEFQGELLANSESKELRFIERDELPWNINPHQVPFIDDWKNELKKPVIK